MPNENHGDTVLNYLACDGTHQGPQYSARWNGDEFIHMLAGAPPRGDRVINYVTWDGTCWQAYWDGEGQRFVHKRFPGGQEEHADVILNYLTWDRSLWTATRSGDGWYHVFISPPAPAPSKNVLAQVSAWIEKHQKEVDAAMTIAKALLELSKKRD